MSLYRLSVVLGVVLSLFGSAGSLFLSWGLGLEACALCFYQRAFVLGCLAVLLVGSVLAWGRVNLAALAFPLAVAGFAIALQHTRLVLNEVIECPAGLFGLGTAPLQSMVLFALLVTALGLGLLTGQGEERSGILAPLLGLVLGVLVGLGCLNSNPPLQAPEKPYEKPLITCRKPYRAPA